MTNEYIDIIRDGIQAYDREPKFPHRVKALFDLVDYNEHMKEHSRKFARAILGRLKALRAVHQEARRTICAQAAAEARLDRLLRRAGKQVPPLPSVAPADPELESVVQTATYKAIGEYYRMRGTGYGAEPPLEAFRELLKAIDALPRNYPPEVCGPAIQYIADQITW